MTSTLKADVKEYVPSWARKPTTTTTTTAIPTNTSNTPNTNNNTNKTNSNHNNNISTMAPPPHPPSRNGGFTTSMTSTNVVKVHSNTATPHTFHPPARSPIAALRFPTRMSPVHAPFPPAVSAMNPNAKDFIPQPSGLSAGALPSLPTSTAELAKEQEKQKQQPQKSPSSAKWTTTSTKNNSTHMTVSPAMKMAVTPSLAPILVEKSEEEILEISRRSDLKVGAAAFVPRRTLHRVNINKPSPFALAPASTEMTLVDLWCLFFLPANTGESIKESTYDPTLVFRVDSVATFWKVFNNISEPTAMDYGTLYFFRDGINPKWEDPGNRDGGIVRVKVDAGAINDAWILLLCRTVGESWSKGVRDTVNGVVLKVRERAYVLEIWITQQTAGLTGDLSELLQPLLGNAFALHYAPHTVVQERAAAAAAALAEKEKKNRNNRRHR